jgi:hypothetical protein
LQRLLERVFNHYARNIGCFLCVPNLYSACWRYSHIINTRNQGAQECSAAHLNKISCP